MKLTSDLKEQIDNKTYEQLLRRWRNSPIGDEIFQGESGDYWADRMRKLRSEPNGNERHVAASKSISWDR